MENNIVLTGHSGIKIISQNIIYIDPYNLLDKENDADYIFITHSHYDHYSPEDILKIRKDNTIIIVPEDLVEDVLGIGFNKENIVAVKPENNYVIEEISFSTVPSYNKTKNFHPKDNCWVGYVININNVKYYIPGDTDFVDEAKKVLCDVAFVPVGGTYTMDYKEASDMINEIKPKIAIPIHYGSIVGSRDDAEKFEKELSDNIICKIMM